MIILGFWFYKWCKGYLSIDDSQSAEGVQIDFLVFTFREKILYLHENLGYRLIGKIFINVCAFTHLGVVNFYRRILGLYRRYEFQIILK